MKIKSTFWICAVITAFFHSSTATALGNKPPMEEPASAKVTSKSTANTTSLSVDVLYRDQQCNVMQAQTRWIDSPQAYQAVFEELRKTYMDGGEHQPPPVDFTQHGVLLVAMGQKNTGGYSVGLAGDEVRVEQGVLSISVQWHEPRKGMMLTQVLTSPCMLVKIPLTPFDRIEIKDQTGTIRLSDTK